MVINTYNFWSTFQGPITKSSNPTGVHVLTVLWSHTPPAHTCTHCSCGWQTPHTLFGEGRLPHFSPLPWLTALRPRVRPGGSQHSASTHRDWWESPRGPRNAGVAGPMCCTMLPAPGRTWCPGEAPPSWGCCHSRVSPLPLLLFMPPLYFFLGQLHLCFKSLF